MRRATTFCALALVLVAASQSLARLSQAADTAIEKITAIDGRPRTYLLYVPTKAKEPLSVVLMFHGGGGNARGAERFSRFDGLAEKEGFVAVYPQGFESHWNDGRGVSFMRAQKDNVDDVKFVRTILDEVAADCKIDRGRVFATGISNGGFMVHRLAAEASDAIAAIAPVVGGMAPLIAEKFNPAKPVSILIIQGDADPVVPIAGGEVRIGDGPPRGNVLATKEALAKYLARNGSKDDGVKPVIVPGPRAGTSVEEFKYPDGPGGVKTYYYLVKGGGHTWPGAALNRQAGGEGVAGKGFQSSEAIWDFFKSCPSRAAAAN